MPMLDRESIKALRQTGEYSALGIQLVATILVFGALGWWIDRTWSLSPWGVMIGSLFGSAGGIFAFIRAILKANKEADNK